MVMKICLRSEPRLIDIGVRLKPMNGLSNDCSELRQNDIGVRPHFIFNFPEPN